MSERSFVQVEPGILRMTGTRRTSYVARAGSGTNRRSRSFAKLIDARKWRAEQMKLIEQGHVHDRTMPTVEQWSREFIDKLDRGTILRSGGTPYRETTIRSYESSLFTHIVPEIGKAKLDMVTYRRVQQLADDLARTYSGSTVGNAIVALSSAFHAARREGLIVETPVRNVRFPRRGRRGDESVVTPEEAARQIALIPPGPYQRLAGFWFYAGLRLGESLALTADDVNPLKRRITISKSRDQFGNTTPPKSGNQRVIPLFDELIALLDAPGPLVPTADRTWIRTQMKRWGLESTPHQARHTFASMLIEAGVTPKELSEYMGHSGIEVTMNVYGHLYPKAFERTIELVDAYLAKRREVR